MLTAQKTKAHSRIFTASNK